MSEMSPATTARRGLTIALPKGRILKEVLPMMARVGIEPEPDFFDDASRKLEFGWCACAASTWRPSWPSVPPRSASAAAT
jgi:hypothetical protein